MEDKLIVKGVHEQIDGDYDCDILGMLTVGHPESMTNRELHRIKLMTGILAGDLMDAINSSDMDASVALTAVILERKGKSFQDDWLWDAPMGAGITFEIRKVKEEEVPPQNDAPKSTPTGGVETSGGVPSEPSSESPENDQSGTGSQPTDTSAI